MRPKQIIISSELRQAAPKLILADIYCSIKDTSYNDELWAEIEIFKKHFREKYNIEDIKHIPTIAATRDAYKACGKDPNRYRPAAEQLCRRILQGKKLYQISTLVDLVNLVSLKSGYSIGGFDLDKIQGEMVYGIGKRNEPYEGIGRGKLNIEGLPVLRDEAGGIGTPTSDAMRTRITESTNHFLMNINCFEGNRDKLELCVVESVSLLKEFVNAQNVHTFYNF